MSVLAIVAIGLPLIAAVVAMITLVVVLGGAKDRRLARTLACLAALVGLWNLAVGLQAVDGAVVLIPGFLNALRYPFVVLPAVVLHVVVRWSGRGERRFASMVASGYVLAAVFALLHQRGLLFHDWVQYEWGAVGRPGPLYPFFVCFCGTWLVAAGVYSWRSLQLSLEPAIRLRMRYLALASLVGVPLGLTNFLPNYGVSIPPLGGLGSILFLAVLGYGALHHRMLDIDVMVLKSAGSVVAATVVVVPVVVAMVFVERSSFGRTDLFLTVGFGLALLLSIWWYARAREVIGRITERSLFPDRHEARRAIERLSREILELAHRERLGQELTATLGRGLGLAGAALYVRSAQDGPRCEASWGAVPGARHPNAASSDDGSGADWELRVPIDAKDHNLGYLALGPKLSGAAIDDLDRTLLRVVASQVAVALQNIDYVGRIEAQTRAIEEQKVAIERQKAEIEELQRLVKEENTFLRAEVRSVSGFGEIVGSSPALQRVLELVDKAARSDASILITGETGTGKELIARAIHELSERRGPLISVNCPAIPPDLAEAELFGCERGAYTGAGEARAGRFELAHGGTLFLDEVADLPLAIQTKLLRVLQEREVQRLGGTKTRRVDVRIVAATNRQLQQGMARGEFRADLYHRLAAIVANLPPLRERSGDIEMLATAFLDRAARTHQKPITAFSPGALAALRSYNWPGNIRELQNVVERAVLLCGGKTIVPEHLGDLVLAQPLDADADSLSSVLREEKERRVKEALLASGGNITGAARLLGVSRSNLSRLIKTLGLRRSDHVQ